MSYLEVRGLTHTFGEKALYKNSEFSLYRGEHIGVVGQNGAGKSTLIGICTGEVIPDDGEVRWQPGIKVGHLDQYADIDTHQSILEFLHSAYRELYALEAQMNELYAAYAQRGQEALSKAADCQNRLEAADFYTIDARIHSAAQGLGITAIGLEKELSNLSGGQRAKVILAKLLLEQPDVLLLDEPTNFLDAAHVQWLAQELADSEKAFLVVSHDSAFLEKIANRICDIGNGKIQKYTGSYQDYLRQKQQREEDYLRRYQSQRREIARTEEFIRKNIAGVNTRIAQGRRKQLARLERMEAPDTLSPEPHFSFTPAPGTPEKLLRIRELLVGYTHPLLPKLNLNVSFGEKLVITGFNGIGKSTLLNTVAGKLPALGGSVQAASAARMGYFTQELLWENTAMTPLEVLWESYPQLDQKALRKHLSRCGISRQHMMQSLGSLSGGEQAKVKLSLMILTPYHLLLLDEPTNHLDARAKKALEEALRSYPGTVILVSHEPRFYEDWADRVWDLGKLGGYEEVERKGIL